MEGPPRVEENVAPMTYAFLLRNIAAELTSANIPNAFQEAFWIVASVSGLSRPQLAGELSSEVPQAAVLESERLKRLRKRGIPLAYLLGETEFFGLKFKVSPAVLIPRPETEVLVEKCRQSLLEKGGKEFTFSILDVGTGSGCIALALLSELPQSRAIATDISKEALKVAKENAAGLGLADRLSLVQASLLESVAGAGRFDLLVSNPPYVSPDEFPRLDRSVRNFEPTVALESPNGGTWFHAQIATQAARVLKSGGLLALEVGEKQAGEVSELIRKTGSYQEPTSFNDLFGVARIVMAKKNEKFSGFLG